MDNLETAGIGKRFAEKDFSTFVSNPENESFFRRVVDYALRFEEFAKEGKGLLLIGSAGIGKTHLAVSALKQIAMQGNTVLFGSFVDIVQNIKSTFGKESTFSESDIIEKLAGIDVLVIDDLGKENISNYVKMIAYQVINRRYVDMKPTIITTNDTSTELEKKYDAATVSRLLESCIVVAFADVKDYRRKLSKENQRSL